MLALVTRLKRKMIARLSQLVNGRLPLRQELEVQQVSFILILGTTTSVCQVPVAAPPT